MTYLPYNPADDCPVPKMWVRLFRLDPRRAAGRFLCGLIPCLLWGAGLFMGIWLVELMVRPDWAYRKVVLVIWYAVVAWPAVLYVGDILRSIWQDREMEAAARASDLRHGKG
jgi:hypothetical protein